MLRDQYPGVDFDVINAAITAINSHVVLPIARGCSRLESDLFVIYLGNNEVFGVIKVGAEAICALTRPVDDIYFLIYTNDREERAMDTAKLFTNGRSQAVRLPKAYRFEGNEVYLKKVAGGVLLVSKDQSAWDIWERNLMKYEEPFMTERNQPKLQQERESLD